MRQVRSRMAGTRPAMTNVDYLENNNLYNESWQFQARAPMAISQVVVRLSPTGW
jgi:hypothetical protein